MVPSMWKSSMVVPVPIGNCLSNVSAAFKITCNSVSKAGGMVVGLLVIF